MSPARKKILICEDDKVTHTILHRIVTESGHLAESAWSGEEASAMILMNSPDVVLLDMLFPDMDGVAVLNSLVDSPAAKQIPVIVMSSSTLEVTRSRLGNHTVHSIVAKPVQQDEVQKALQTLFNEGDRPNRPNFLVLDSSPIHRKMYDRVIAGLTPELGCDIIFAENIEDASRRLSRSPFTAVLADVGKDPSDVLTLIKCLPEGSAIPVIALLATVDLTVVRSLLAQGVYDILLKPLQISRLANTLERIIVGAQPVDEKEIERKSVLIVEDFTITARTMESMLHSAGYNTVVARSAELAYDHVSRNPPDLIILDLNLPGMDGAQLIIALKAANFNIPFIITSGSRDLDMLKEIQKLGCEKIFPKPVNTETLVQFVQAFFTSDKSAGVAVPPSPKMSDVSTADFKRMVLEELGKLPDPADADFRKQLRLFAHNIAGSAGLVNREDLSAIGKDLEDRSESDTIERLSQAIKSLRTELDSLA